MLHMQMLAACCTSTVLSRLHLSCMRLHRWRVAAPLTMRSAIAACFHTAQQLIQCCCCLDIYIQILLLFLAPRLNCIYYGCILIDCAARVGADEIRVRHICIFHTALQLIQCCCSLDVYRFWHRSLDRRCVERIQTSIDRSRLDQSRPDRSVSRRSYD